jgi:hypothetical protein
MTPDKRSHPGLLAACVLAFAASMGLCLPARADDVRAAPLLPAYKAECAACHIAYPAGLLPAASWQRLMTQLPTHFGTDASLDAATVAALSTWLTANAAQGRRAAPPPAEDRITRSAWFIRKHDDVPAATWKRPSIKSASNCMACHSGADRGDFDERNIRIPR